MSDLKAPWSVHVDHQTSAGRFDVFSSEGYLVAMATTRERADLICAAPELLEALERLVIAAENIGGEHITGLMDLDNATGFARMKIKKALGQ